MCSWFGNHIENVVFSAIWAARTCAYRFSVLATLDSIERNRRLAARRRDRRCSTILSINRSHVRHSRHVYTRPGSTAANETSNLTSISFACSSLVILVTRARIIRAFGHRYLYPRHRVTLITRDYYKHFV